MLKNLYLLIFNINFNALLPLIYFLRKKNQKAIGYVPFKIWEEPFGKYKHFRLKDFFGLQIAFGKV